MRGPDGNGYPDLEGRQKRIAVLAYLGAALPYGFQRRDRLFGLFWPEKTQAQARKSLNQSLLIIRDAIGEKDIVQSRGDAEIALHADLVAVDVQAFDAAMDRGDYDAALELYRGDFLDGFYVPDVPEFERWADQERTRLRHAALRAAFIQVQRWEESGDYLAAVERSRWAVRMAPLDEGVFRQYLELLDRHGDRSTALREYTAFVERLDDDYGVDPSPETQALVAQIRARATPRPDAGTAPERDDGAAERDELWDLMKRALSGTYDVFEEIGHGGMAVVYRGHDRGLDRDVAIKVLRPELAKSIAADRFLQEIHVEAAIEHPNVIAVYDSGSADGIPYYVMQLVRGETLRARMKRERQLNLDDALRITTDVAAALQAAHDNGVVHRDVKPENILLADGRAVVSDFGVARALTEAGATEFTVTGVAIGTPGYMSPEQAMADQVDARSDQYALACVLYEMLTGEMLFTGPTARAILAKHVSAVPTPVSVLRENARPLEGAILRALSKTPADRFPTVTAMLDGLERGTAAPAAPVLTGRRSGALRLAAAVAAVAVVTTVAVVIFLDGETAPLNDRHVIVFPFGEGAVSEGATLAAETVRDAVWAAMHATEYLRITDGTELAGPDGVPIVGRVDRRTAVAITRREGARYGLRGTVIAGPPHSLLLELHDIAADSVIARSVLDPDSPASAWRLGLRGAIELLTEIIPTGAEIDVEAIEDRHPLAVANFLQGERAYRSARFEEALYRYELAIAVDSTFARAALRGAQVASWNLARQRARQLVALALVHGDSLSPRHRHFARGLAAYHDGAADSGLVHLERALAIDSTWPEAWMAIGEIYWHLLPDRADLLGSAEEAFDRVSAADPGFVPVRYHQLQIAILEGRASDAEGLYALFAAGEPDRYERIQIDAMRRCVFEGGDAMDWEAAVHDSVEAVIDAAVTLEAAGAQFPCAERAWRAVLEHDTTTGSRRLANQWSSVQGLQGVLAAQGRTEETYALLDSADAWELPSRFFRTLDEIVEPNLFPASESVPLRTAAAGDWDGLDVWLMGVWHARVGSAQEASRLQGILERRSKLDSLTHASGQGEATRDSVLAALLAGQLAVHETTGRSHANAGDVLTALLSPRTRDIMWSLWESRPFTRLRLAEWLLTQGRYREAIRIASGFDSPQPVIFTLFLPRSLAIRLRAATLLKDDALASRYTETLVRIGRDDVVKDIRTGT